jgi:hypothetical protein
MSIVDISLEELELARRRATYFKILHEISTSRVENERAKNLTPLFNFAKKSDIEVMNCRENVRLQCPANGEIDLAAASLSVCGHRDAEIGGAVDIVQGAALEIPCRWRRTPRISDFFVKAFFCYQVEMEKEEEKGEREIPQSAETYRFSSGAR